MLNPLTPPRVCPQALEEPDGSTLAVGTIVGTHYVLDCFRGFLSVIEWDSRDVVVEDMGLNDAVEQRPSYKSEITIDRCGSSCGEIPGLGSIARDGGVGVLQVRDMQLQA